MVLCLESGFLLGSKADQHQLKKDPEEILVVPVEWSHCKVEIYFGGKQEILLRKKIFFILNPFTFKLKTPLKTAETRSN